MKKLLLFLSTLFVYTLALCQTAPSTLPFRADTILLKKEGGYTNLKVKDITKDTLGIAYNAGDGLYRFKKPYIIDDSTIVIGADTLVLKGGAATAAGVTIGEVNDAINTALSGLPIYMDSLLIPGTGDMGDRYTIDTLLYIETKANSKQRIDSLIDVVANLAITGGGGVMDIITNAGGTGDTLWKQTNDSVGEVKRLKNGTNVTFTVDGNSITINAATGTTEINMDSLHVSTTTTNILDGARMLTYVLVKPASNITDFQVGTVADPTKFFPSIPITADGEYTILDVGAYIQGATNVQLKWTGTIVTDIQLIFQPLHQ